VVKVEGLDMTMGRPKWIVAVEKDVVLSI